MAKKASTGSAGAGKPATRDLETRLVDAMLDLVAREGWQAVALPAIAEGAGAALSDLYPSWRSRTAVLAAFMRRIDREVVKANFAFAPEDKARDRLFEVLMHRFDALQPYREAVQRIRSGLVRDPAASAAAMCQLGCSMAWMLQSAGLSSDGATGKIKTAGLAGLWLRGVAVWVEDDSKDMSRTMAALDQGLKRADRWAEFAFCRRRPRDRDSAEAA